MMHKKKFTLIEMLVVIAIIAILAAMIMPSLQNALKTAQSISCRNSMRQIFMGMTAYSVDNSNFFPALSTHTRTNAWHPWWKPTVTGSYLGITAMNNENPDIIRCPAVSTSYGIGYNNFDYPYPRFNTNVLDYYEQETFRPWKEPWYRITRGRNLAKLLVYADTAETKSNGVVTATDSFGNFDRINYRHARVSNAAFADGHIRGANDLSTEYLIKVIDVQMQNR